MISCLPEGLTKSNAAATDPLRAVAAFFDNRICVNPINFIRLLITLERIPIGWNHPIDKNTLKINLLEHVLIGKVSQLFRNML
jgi:hypothetical protein